MIPVPSATTLTALRPASSLAAFSLAEPSGGGRFPGSARTGAVCAVGVVACLVGLAAGLLWAASPPAQTPGEELARLAQALRQNPNAKNYQLLARFAADYAESELSAQASFALGMADLRAQRWMQARERLGAARSSRRLGDYATLNLARAEIELGALEAAQQTLWGLLPAGSLLSETARVLEAGRLVRAGRAEEAVGWLKRPAEGRERPALLLALAKAHRAAGEPVAAAEVLQRIYFEFPLSPEAEPSNQLLAQLRSEELKGNYPAPSEALRRARAEKLWAQQAFRGARSAYVDLSVRASEPTRTEARLRAALSLYHLGEARAACRELGEIDHVSPPLEGEFRAYRVRCGLRAGQDAAVEGDLDYLAAHFPRTAWYERVLLVVGNTALGQGEVQPAREIYRRLVKAFPGGEAAAEAHWKLAWLAYQDKETAAATRLFEDHLHRFPESPFWPRALYWRAQAAHAVGADRVAERLLGVLRDYAPREYLSQQAERLQQRLPGAAADDGDSPAWLENLARVGSSSDQANRGISSPASPVPSPVHAVTEKAAVLARLGFPELAGEVLEAGLQQWPHPELHLAQARLAYSQQKYARATEILRRAHPNYWRYRLDQLPREAWELLFPRPYWEMIEREAGRQRLDPYLVAALIRQESRFERDAVSSAGALGLMQLMPVTARQLAGAQRLSQSRIQDPRLNIRLGTRLLAQLLRRFDGSLEKAVAGYNAGGTRVAEWDSQRDYGQPAEFVESIPVTQTRHFVYTVLRNYRFYRDLYADEKESALSTVAAETTDDTQR